MPRAAIESSTATPYREPHERKDGPWQDHELEEGGRHLERAEKIKGNGKYVEAIAKHHEGRAKTHRKLAHQARHLRGQGMISDKALARAAEKRHRE